MSWFFSQCGPSPHHTESNGSASAGSALPLKRDEEKPCPQTTMLQHHDICPFILVSILTYFMCPWARAGALSPPWQGVGVEWRRPRSPIILRAQDHLQCVSLRSRVVQALGQCFCESFPSIIRACDVELSLFTGKSCSTTDNTKCWRCNCFSPLCPEKGYFSLATSHFSAMALSYSEVHKAFRNVLPFLSPAFCTVACYP